VCRGVKKFGQHFVKEMKSQKRIPIKLLLHFYWLNFYTEERFYIEKKSNEGTKLNMFEHVL
jgi:hypothetical protein